jgi:hypothetical protein
MSVMAWQTGRVRREADYVDKSMANGAAVVEGQDENGTARDLSRKGKMNGNCLVYSAGVDVESLELPAGHWILTDGDGFARVSGENLEEVAEIGRRLAGAGEFCFEDISLEQALTEAQKAFLYCGGSRP